MTAKEPQYSPNWLGCPVCFGRGRLPDKTAPWWKFWAAAPCLECGGRGMVFVGGCEKPPSSPPPPPKKAEQPQPMKSYSHLPCCGGHVEITVSPDAPPVVKHHKLHAKPEKPTPPFPVATEYAVDISVVTTGGVPPGFLDFVAPGYVYRVDLMFHPSIIGSFLGVAQNERTLNSGGVYLTFRTGPGDVKAVSTRDIRRIERLDHVG